MCTSHDSNAHLFGATPLAPHHSADIEPQQRPFPLDPALITSLVAPPVQTVSHQDTRTGLASISPSEHSLNVANIAPASSNPYPVPIPSSTQQLQNTTAPQPTRTPIDRHASATAKRAASRRSGGGAHDQGEDETTQKEYEEMLNGVREDLRKEKSFLSPRAYRARLKLMVSIASCFYCLIVHIHGFLLV